MKPFVVAVVGPTAVGKTNLSVEIARQFNGEVISGDSMQVYQGLDIGTAKATVEERGTIPHHLIDIKKPAEAFSAAEFQQYVNTCISQITARGRLPVIAGGTGLYIQAVLEGYNFSKQPRDPDIHSKLEKEVSEKGIEPFYRRLQKVDPEQAGKIPPQNIRRVIRALEVYETTGLTMTEYRRQQKTELDFDPILIGLEMDRQQLYHRINERIDRMLEDGLIEEARMLYDQGRANSQAMQAIGYKEFIPYFKGESSLEEAVERVKRNSRRYAKRQYTWFKNKMNVHWYTVTPDLKSGKFEIILRDLAGMLEKR